MVVAPEGGGEGGRWRWRWRRRSGLVGVRFRSGGEGARRTGHAVRRVRPLGVHSARRPVCLVVFGGERCCVRVWLVVAAAARSRFPPHGSKPRTPQSERMGGGRAASARVLRRPPGGPRRPAGPAAAAVSVSRRGPAASVAGPTPTPDRHAGTEHVANPLTIRPDGRRHPAGSLRRRRRRTSLAARGGRPPRPPRARNSTEIIEPFPRCGLATSRPPRAKVLQVWGFRNACPTPQRVQPPLSGRAASEDSELPVLQARGCRSRSLH